MYLVEKIGSYVCCWMDSWRMWLDDWIRSGVLSLFWCVIVRGEWKYYFLYDGDFFEEDVICFGGECKWCGGLENGLGIVYCGGWSVWMWYWYGFFICCVKEIIVRLKEKGCID